jgi:hypothetical protein
MKKPTIAAPTRQIAPMPATSPWWWCFNVGAGGAGAGVGDGHIDSGIRFCVCTRQLCMYTDQSCMHKSIVHAHSNRVCTQQSCMHKSIVYVHSNRVCTQQLYERQRGGASMSA